MFYYLNTFFSWMLGLTNHSSTSSATFELYEDLLGEYRFLLRAGNDEIILVSEGYATKWGAKKGIRSVKRNASDEISYERKTAKNGQFMFNLRADNYEVIGTSELYASAYNRDQGIQSVKRNAPNADIVDLS